MQKDPERSEQNPASLLNSCGEWDSYIACKYLCKIRKQIISIPHHSVVGATTRERLKEGT